MGSLPGHFAPLQATRSLGVPPIPVKKMQQISSLDGQDERKAKPQIPPRQAWMRWLGATIGQIPMPFALSSASPSVSFRDGGKPSGPSWMPSGLEAAVRETIRRTTRSPTR